MNTIKIAIIGFCLVLVAVAFGKPACAAEHFVGITTLSRHWTADHSKYNERNWGGFYELRDNSLTYGAQVGYYDNSYFRTSWYTVGMWQPWRLGPAQIGGFFGAVTGYEDKPIAIFGAVVTFTTDGVSPQFIINPAVGGLQFKGQPWKW